MWPERLLFARCTLLLKRYCRRKFHFLRFHCSHSNYVECAVRSTLKPLVICSMVWEHVQLRQAQLIYWLRNWAIQHSYISRKCILSYANFSKLIEQTLLNAHSLRAVSYAISIHVNILTSNCVCVTDDPQLTSHGGGALLYEGTILNVTEPRASRWK